MDIPTNNHNTSHNTLDISREDKNVNLLWLMEKIWTQQSQWESSSGDHTCLYKAISVLRYESGPTRLTDRHPQSCSMSQGKAHTNQAYENHTNYLDSPYPIQNSLQSLRYSRAVLTDDPSSVSKCNSVLQFELNLHHLHATVSPVFLLKLISLSCKVQSKFILWCDYIQSQCKDRKSHRFASGDSRHKILRFSWLHWDSEMEDKHATTLQRWNIKVKAWREVWNSKSTRQVLKIWICYLIPASIGCVISGSKLAQALADFQS